MPGDDRVGITDETRAMPIERGKIREFARACNDSNPEYVDAPTPPVPPTFLTTRNFWMSAETSPLARVGLDLRRLLHGGEEYVFHGPPPRAGEELTFQTRVDKVYEKEGKRGGPMTFVETVVEFRDADGRLRVECRSTAIETGRPPESEKLSDRDAGTLRRSETAPERRGGGAAECGNDES